MKSMNQLALELFAPDPVVTAIRAALDNHDQSCSPHLFKTATEAYSADKIGQNQPVRTFQWRGCLYTTTATAGAACPGGAYVHAWKIVAKDEYPNATFTYPGNPKMRFSYEGMLVKCKGAVCVLAGPELELRP
jgi:hypothetical protein